MPKPNKPKNSFAEVPLTQEEEQDSNQNNSLASADNQREQSEQYYTPGCCDKARRMLTQCKAAVFGQGSEVKQVELSSKSNENGDYHRMVAGYVQMH